VISVGGAKDITRIYVERMLAPHGVKPGEFDMVFAGATSARASALLAGAVDAAILLPPFNFQAEAQGFTNLGLTVEYAPELPFSGTVVNKAWAAKNQDILKRVLGAHSKSVEWFYDDKNRAEAITILSSVSSLKPDDVAKSYDFFRKNAFFDRTGAVSRKKMNALIDALTSLGDVQAKGNIERFVMPGITQIAD
jgi:ABC-type nitrate/sulfonate/bicarbonate transport system substrate-binding protein